jgi:hypothetical protein
MRRTALALAFTSFAVVGWLVPPAAAQGTKTARGTVTTLSESSLTIKAATADMTFVVDAKTTVEASGAGTTTRAAEAAGKPGPKLADLLKTGQSVEVTYSEAGGTLRATLIRRVPSAGGTPEPATKSANGTVQSVSGNTLTITGNSGGGATFTQTFVIAATTRVIGRGLGTATAAQGGKAQVTDIVKAGDSVRVVYREAGGSLLAVEVGVTSK